MMVKVMVMMVKVMLVMVMVAKVVVVMVMMVKVMTMFVMILMIVTIVSAFGIYKLIFLFHLNFLPHLLFPEPMKPR